MTGMSEHVNEQLSALADDELPGEEMPLLLRRLGRDPELVDRLGRYYTTRAAVHGDLGLAADGAFAERVAAALDAEPALDPAEAEAPVHPEPAAHRRRVLRFARPVAGAAIAASVAVLAVGLWPSGPGERGNGPAATAVTASAPSAGGGNGLAERVSVDEGPATADSVERVTWQGLDPTVQRRLNGYLVNHSGNAVGAGAGGMLNYARIAGHARAE
ncbi:hypothetical protein KBTX_00911 [wastewater metagenome]|uniref:Anti sigma-E protein RseA N-terminal domain-containing protein n=3 Tax=root TaxID=1 RepID=A0A5B8R9E8_9ZZZZ|nr:hypothetical protein KBTEX_00911 [uncultured organism]